MASEELVTEQFQFLGIDVQKEVLRKCVSLCEEYDVDAESLIEQWIAFSLNNLNGASPNLENLDLFVRKEFSKRTSRTNAPGKETTQMVTGTCLTVYGGPVSAQYISNFNYCLQLWTLMYRSDNEVLSNYMAVTPKRAKIANEPATQNELCPSTYSPTVVSVKYASRNNMGTVVHSYGDEKLLQEIADPNGPNDMFNLTVSQIPNEDGDIYTKAMVGFELLHEKASTYDSHINYVSQCIMKKFGITESVSVRHKTQTEVFVCGRIECDADARLNPKCVILQGTWEESLSQAVPVDIDNLKQYSLFSGQVVVMKGTNPRGDKFIATDVLCDGSKPNTDLTNTLTGKISMVVAAGPYTTSDNMAYEPLKDLVTYVNTHKPHVLIMTGPFMDSDHAKIKDNTLAETFNSFFDKILDSLAELSNTSPFTKVYIVSNIKDAFQINIYPTPPYTSRRKHSNIQFIPDPSTLNINGVILGVTSTDVLMHISQEEISLGMGGDKLSRLAGQVLSQQTYYPVWPPAAGELVDAALWAAHAQLPCTPHLLILPSNFRYFAKAVNGSVVVNPEHLTKGAGGGTFARILISTDNQRSINIATQIIRI